MMSKKHPRLSGKELLRLLQKVHGFELIRTKGSHHFVEHADGRKTVIPVHGRDELGPGLLAKICRDIELRSEDLDDK